MMNHRHTLSMTMLQCMLLMLLTVCMTACNGNNNEPEVFPIRFPHQDYTIMEGMTSQISFADGTGQYRIEIGNTDVIRKAEIDQDTRTLAITPAGIGESTVSIADVPTGQILTLNISVIYFHLTFSIREIEGQNNNPYLKVGADMVFVKAPEDRKGLVITTNDPLQAVAYGIFDITKGETEFTVEMSLHAKENEELALYTYSSVGETTAFDIFNLYFNFGWEKTAQPRSLPIFHPTLILTDPTCTIRATLQPFSIQ